MTEGAGAPRAWVLVTGAATNLSEAERATAVLLGKLLGREGYGLLSGTWGGTDEIVTRAFVAQVPPAAIRERIVQIENNPMYSSHSLRVGRLIKSPRSEGYSQEAVELADVGIVLSGRKGSKPAMDALALHGKPVLPLAWLGNDAHACLVDLLNAIGPSRGERRARRLLMPFIDPACARDETISRALGAWTSKRHDIFLSYHRDDTGPDAGRIAAALSEEYGSKRVFIDYMSFQAAQLLEQLMVSARSARVLIVFMGRRWISRVSSETDYVRREVLAAMSGGACIIPVMVDANFPEESEFPAALKEMSAIAALHLNRTRWDDTLNELEAIIDARLGVTKMVS